MVTIDIEPMTPGARAALVRGAQLGLGDVARCLTRLAEATDDGPLVEQISEIASLVSLAVVKAGDL